MFQHVASADIGHKHAQHPRHYGLYLLGEAVVALQEPRQEK
jgi:hypothetical protein